MKKGLLILIAAVLAGMAAYLVSFRSATHSTRSILETSDAEMGWLRHEFKLTPQQAETIRVLRDNYKPTCGRLCARVSASNQKLKELAYTNKTVTPEIAAALKETMAVQEECRREMLGHIYQVSAVMDPQSGARYVQMMLPYVVEPPIGHAVMQHAQ